MSAQTLEERLTAVETKLGQLEREKEQNKKQNQEQDKEAEPRGWQHIVGIFADDPEFEEAVKAGKEWRASEDNFNNSDV